ncbi:MAG: right-handed parallel beta-helix repeat-containing protein, partial [Planctomycetia bacterium]
MLAVVTWDGGAEWRVTAAAPPVEWTSPSFDDSAFTAATMVGTQSLGGQSADTFWSDDNSSDVWIRGSLTLDGSPASAVLAALADDDMELYVNGVRFVNDADSSPTTVTRIDVTAALTAGTNSIAAHVHNAGGNHGFAARIEVDTERPDAGDTLATAMNTGVVPGMHLAGVTLADAADADLYRVELLRTDSLRAIAALDEAGGSLSLSILDSDGQTIATGSESAGQMVADAASLPAGTYYLRVSGTVAQKAWYHIGVEAGSGSTTRVIYVNDGSASRDVYALATGDDANDGLSPSHPKASVQGVLSSYVVDPHTLIVVDTGDYGSSYGSPSYGTVSIGTADEGGTYVGSPAGSRFSAWQNRFELTGARYNTFYGLTFADHGNPSGTGIRISSGSGIASIGNVIRGNTFLGTSIGVAVGDNSGATVEANGFAVPSNSRYAAVEVSGTSAVTLRANDIAGSSYGVIVGTSATAVIRDNTIHQNATGIFGGSRLVTVAGNTIWANTVGSEGSFDIGGGSWSDGQPNLYTNNDIGARAYAGASVAYNRFESNRVGVRVNDTGSDTGSIHHDIFLNNSAAAVEISNSQGRSVVSNTIVATAGIGVRVVGNSSNVVLRDNIITTDSGTAVYVASDSQQGFASDYNNLYRAPTGTGTLVWWQKPFADLFDWQVEADLDSHSIGWTAPDPLRDAPAFVNSSAGDYRLVDGGSTSIDAGDPADPFSSETGLNGGRIDLGAYGNTPLAAHSVAREIRLAYPEYYADWPAAQGRAILWSTYDPGTVDNRLAGFVRLELHQEGVGKVCDIATVSASDGSYGWSPQESDVIPSTGARYRIVLVSLDDAAVSDRSREPFSIPALTANYFVDDALNTNDEFTPLSTGDNRHTGTTALDPKANLLPLLRSYDLGPGDTVKIDTGTYIHVRNVMISGEADRGNDEGATFTGPSDPANVARIDRANRNQGSTAIEVNDGDYVSIRNLTLTGASVGLWVHNGSDAFTLGRMTVSGNSADGIRWEGVGSATLADLTATDNGGTGISLAEATGTLRTSTVSGNGSGIVVTNWSSVTPMIIGSTELAAGAGNLVFNNLSSGISASGNVVVAGNSAWGQSTGISVSNGSVARNNVVFDNATGISGSYGGTIDANRVF